MINFKAVGISVALFALAFKLNNVMPTSLPFPILALIIGLSLVFVYLSRIIIRVEKDELLLSSAVVAGIIMLAINYINPATLGITNVAKLVEIPGTQGILSWFVTDIVGIPSYAIWIAFIAVILFMFINPMIGFGILFLLVGAVIFLIAGWQGWGIPASIVSEGIGLLTIIMGITRGKGTRVGGSRMLSQPIINVYNSDSPGPMIGSSRKSSGWNF